jgi:IS5 family transposase
MVDATIIHAPSSTKNKEEGRDPDRHQAQKGDLPCLGIKAPIGVDRKTYR